MIFVRDFQALDIPAICFAKGYLVIWEAVERIERLQMLSKYSGSARMRHSHVEKGRKSSRNQGTWNDACDNARNLPEVAKMKLHKVVFFQSHEYIGVPWSITTLSRVLFVVVIK